jgi:hypothetical protein
MERFPPRRKQALAGHGEARLSAFTKPLCGRPQSVSKLNGQRPYLTLRSNRGVHMVSRSEHVLRVGQDSQGHWVVQEEGGMLEALFRSRDAAVRFALSECRAFPGARMVLATTPLHSILSH